ncbi:hypothetical protein P3S67_009712 [Capsicum chacoense]
MEQYIPGKHGNKRCRDDSDLGLVYDSSESKRVHTEPVNAGSSLVQLNRAKSESELEVNHYNLSKSAEFDEADADVDGNSPEVKQIREDILDILDEPEEEVTDGVRKIDQELDSVIKSFEDEILHPYSTQPPQNTLTLSHSGESQSDLGYLLEASDDDLGLLPTVSPGNDIDADESRLRNFTGFDNELLRYDSLDFAMLDRIMDGDNYGGENDGIFDYPEDLSNFSELSRLPESLPAL